MKGGKPLAGEERKSCAQRRRDCILVRKSFCFLLPEIWNEKGNTPRYACSVDSNQLVTRLSLPTVVNNRGRTLAAGNGNPVPGQVQIRCQTRESGSVVQVEGLF